MRKYLHIDRNKSPRGEPALLPFDADDQKAHFNEERYPNR